MSSASASKIFQFGWGVQIPNTASLLVLDAIFYLVRGGIAWRALPADFPPHQTVYALFRRWNRAREGCGSTQRCVNVRVWPTGAAQCRPRP
jgi:transposase